MDIKMTPEGIWNEYQSLTEYLTEHDVYNVVKKNEKFYDGRQWDGAKADNIAKPTMNRLQRIGKYQIASLSSNDVGIAITPLMGGNEDKRRMKIIADEVKNIIEQAKIKEQARLMIRNAFVDGASYSLQSFDPDYETGQDSKGKIDSQLIDMTNVYFGNPYTNVLQKQPYIIIALRQFVGQVKEEAKDLGVKNIDDITPDTDDNYDEDSDGKLCTVLLKFWKQKKKQTETKVIIDDVSGEEIIVEEEKEIKTVHFCKCTKAVMLVEDTDLGYTRYPIARFGWEPRRNSYLYESPMTSNIVNQVFINKCYAYAHEYALKSAMPKIIYDEGKMDIDDFLEGSTIGVPGIDLLGKYLDFAKMPDFSNQIIQLIDQTGAEMEKNMGVNDAALGNVRPDNSSAIIALQEAAAVPLEIQRQNFYEMWEDTVRNLIDIMTCSYGVRMLMDNETGEPVMVDFNKLRGINYQLNIDVGSSAQYSEIAQMNTLNSLLQNGMIDLDTFLEVCPDKYIPQKETIKRFNEEKQQQAEQMAAMQQGANVPMGVTQ